MEQRPTPNAARQAECAVVANAAKLTRPRAPLVVMLLIAFSPRLKVGLDLLAQSSTPMGREGT